jgi:hypothetical protein
MAQFAAESDSKGPRQVTILNVPGLAKTSLQFVQALIAMADRNPGWSASGIAGTIASESGFDPSIRPPINPKTGKRPSSAVGLIQFLDDTAQKLGTSTSALANMSAIEQLTYVEKFFQRNMRKIPTNLADYKLVVLGRGDLVGASDDAVVYSATDPNPKIVDAYNANKSLDPTDKGYISVGDIRRLMQRYVSPSLGELDMKKLAVVAAGGAELLIWAALGFFAWRKARARARSA